MLDDRKKRVLQAIVEEYINSAEPVSSASISKNYGLDYSSATIRNEMANLEHIGYLEKPHTSAGRIPSAKGYRFYVDELLNDNNISIEEIKYIQTQLETKVNEIQDLTKIATTTLSEITHYTTLSIGPKTNMHNIEEIKFVLLGTRILMAVILTDAGIIKETIIKFDEDINQNQVDTLNYVFNSKLKGKSLDNIDRPMKEFIVKEMSYSINVIKPIINQINKVVNEETKIFLEGANKSFDLPEFKSLSIAKNFINILDTKEIVFDILNTGFANDINIYIGNENENDDLKDFSIVTFNHTFENKDLGTIGIIGPTRMNYSKVVSVMKYISKKLNEQFNS